MGCTSNRYKVLHIFMLAANCVAFLLGVLYLIWNPDNTFTNIIGIYLMIIFLLNIIQAFLDPYYNKKGYWYLAISMLFMFLIPIFNLIFSFLPDYKNSRSIISVVAILTLFILGGIIAALNLFRKKSDIDLLLIQIAEKHEEEPKKQRTIRIVSMVILSLFLTIGLFISFSLLFNTNIWRTEVFISAFSLFYAYLFLSAGALLIKLMHRHKKVYIKLLCSILTLCIFIICLLPAASVPALVKDAEISYLSAFESYHDNPIFSEIDSFRQNKFSIPEYFFGTLSRNYTVRRNIPFYAGVEGVDRDLILYFDVYTSSEDADWLPGGNSVLIRIHGGEWKYGDKGFLNNAQMNKYFASQGYVVFDIQYGLTTINNKHIPSGEDQSRYGEFTTDDMVRHLGKFTQYLAENHDEFNANIDSVFVSGSSAGGNLALALGLAHSSGEYQNLFDQNIKIRGIIPFYPANGLAQDMGLAVSDSGFISPEVLADKPSPPCLVFQGQRDSLVKAATTMKLKDQYEARDNNECAIIFMPFGGHSCDVYFPGYYNQTFLYYMERFMFFYR